MKTHIITVACLLLLMAFPLQSMLDAANNARFATFDGIVQSSAEEARLEGRFTPVIIDSMRNKIAAAFNGVQPNEIVINVTTAPKYRGNTYDERELITYEVKLPVDDLLVGGVVFGAVDDSGLYYTCKGAVSSEVYQGE